MHYTELLKTLKDILFLFLQQGIESEPLFPAGTSGPSDEVPGPSAVKEETMEASAGQAGDEGASTSGVVEGAEEGEEEEE